MSLTDEQKSQLEKESWNGDRHKAAWDSLVEPFFSLKEQQLFESFKDCGSTQMDGLSLIHMQFNVLKSMREHFEHYINTGNMAKMTLNQDKEKELH